MSVVTKGRRKITYDNQEYVWYVSQDDESDFYILHTISEDKQLILSVPLQVTTPYVISKGKLFQGQKTNGRWNRYLLPFDIPDVITPKSVATIISWATKDSNAVKVEWDGKDIIV